mmetsp:Transcript_58889/g.132964  ORF Transcript_58889/g.132964 Transcript_58889/m.132964 type:complete len:253 (-) Transcript_58889:94-852(-)
MIMVPSLKRTVLNDGPHKKRGIIAIRISQTETPFGMPCMVDPEGESLPHGAQACVTAVISERLRFTSEELASVQHGDLTSAIQESFFPPSACAQGLGVRDALGERNEPIRCGPLQLAELIRATPIEIEVGDFRVKRERVPTIPLYGEASHDAMGGPEQAHRSPWQRIGFDHVQILSGLDAMMLRLNVVVGVRAIIWIWHALPERQALQEERHHHRRATVVAVHKLQLPRIAHAGHCVLAGAAQLQCLEMKAW